MVLYWVIPEYIYIAASKSAVEPLIKVMYTKRDDSIYYFYIKFSDTIDTTDYVWENEQAVDYIDVGETYALHCYMGAKDIPLDSCVTVSSSETVVTGTYDLTIPAGYVAVIYTKSPQPYAACTKINGTTISSTSDADGDDYAEIAVVLYAVGSSETVTIDQSGCDPAYIYVFDPPYNTVVWGTVFYEERDSNHATVYSGSFNTYIMRPIDIELAYY